MPDPRPDDLVILTHADSEFGARAKVVVLEEAGIPAVVFPGEAAWLGAPAFQRQHLGVPVWVRADDRERAAEALARQIADSVDLDWDEADIGEPEPETRQLTEGGPWGRLLLLTPLMVIVVVLVWMILAAAV